MLARSKIKESLTTILNDFVCDPEEMGCPGRCDECMADHLIDNGVTIQRWIPVTERMPEDALPKDSKVKQMKVLVAYKTNGRWIVRTQIRAKGYYYGDPEKWEWIKTSDPIYHWAPVPLPPLEAAR